MNKAMIVGVALVSLAGCSKPAAKATGEGDAGAAATVGSASTTSAAKSVVDKALSFLTGGPFEGAITMRVADNAKTAQSITYEVKGDKMRFDRPTGPDPGYVIVDGKKFTSVDVKKKMAIEMSMEGFPGVHAAGPAAAAAGEKPTIDKTGKTETIAGYSCEIWNITTPKGEKTEACMAKGIAFPSIGKSHDSWMSDLVDEKLFPLRVSTKDASGKETMRMDVTQIEKKSIPDSEFEVPAGYKTQSMQDMMKSFGAAMGHGHP